MSLRYGLPKLANQSLRSGSTGFIAEFHMPQPFATATTC